MLNQSIGWFDGGHCSGSVVASANRQIVVGELQFEARESDTHYSLAIATAVSLSCPCGTESWWAAGDIYMSVGRVGAHARFRFTKTQKD
jgi:hypothetical protein